VNIVHLAASRLFGGPERQMLGLANSIQSKITSKFILFYEDGLNKEFLKEIQRNDCEGYVLKHDTPRLLAAIRELVQILQHWKADILLCHCNKPNLLGLIAARWLGIPIISVSHGWTRETFRVKIYDFIDRYVLRWMDRIVSVSEGQASKVLYAGISEEKSRVIRCAVRMERFANPLPEYRQLLLQCFSEPPDIIVGAAGRLSPEKGFGVLVDASVNIIKNHPNVGFVLFGDGALHGEINRQINKNNIANRFVLVGFRSDLDRFIPHFDLLVQPSFTEGLPNIILEAYASSVPVVATSVGGVPEIIEDKINGLLAPPGNSEALTRCLEIIINDNVLRRKMAGIGYQRVRDMFSFELQAKSYLTLFNELLGKTKSDLFASATK
jgi:glycosyltransferase involved in cell wall biosynthesis